jgi:hypothetical protein
MEKLHGFDFIRLKFDENGALQPAQPLDELKQHIQTAAATDAIFIAHGFRNDENDATTLYDRFLDTFRTHVDGPFRQSLGPRKFVVAGVYWPSKKFPEDVKLGGSVQALDDEFGDKEEARQKLEDLKATAARPDQKAKLDRASQLLDRVKGNKQAQDEFVSLVLSLLDDTPQLDSTEGVDAIKAKDGSELLDALKTPIILPTASDGDEGGVTAVGPVVVTGEDGGTEGIASVFGSIFGRIGQFLNLTTWYLMKNRAGVVGSTGVAQAVRDVKAARPAIRIHLVGHSLGGRVMAACAKALAQTPKLQPDSLTLLEAAFSHYGFSPNNGKGQAGFFRAVMDSKVVKGPLISTFSKKDTVVGTAYAITSRLAGDSVQEIGDANDPFGGIGRNGAQKTAEAVIETLHTAGTAYSAFAAGKVICLDGSEGLINDHGDVTNSNVTYAFASAVAQT